MAMQIIYSIIYILYTDRIIMCVCARARVCVCVCVCHHCHVMVILAVYRSNNVSFHYAQIYSYNDNNCTFNNVHCNLQSIVATYCKLCILLLLIIIYKLKYLNIIIIINLFDVFSVINVCIIHIDLCTSILLSYA